MPVNWTSGKRQLAKTKLQSRNKPNKTKNQSVPHKNIDQSIPAEKLFSNFTFASPINRAPVRSRGLLEEKIISEPSTQPPSVATSTVHTRSEKSPEHLTNAEKRDSLLQMESWTWLLKSNQDPRQGKIDNGVTSHRLLRYDDDGLEPSLPLSSPGIGENDLTREISGSYTSLPNKTDRQSEIDVASSTIEESEGSQSAVHEGPHPIISYQERGHYFEDQEMNMRHDYDSFLKEPAPNAQKAVEDIFIKSPESLEVEKNRIPTIQRRFQTIPSLMKSIEGSRRQVLQVPSDVITGVRNKSKEPSRLERNTPKPYRKISSSSEESSDSDDFSDILAAASHAAKRRKVNVGKTSTFFNTNRSHPGGSLTKKTISNSDTLFERHFLSSDDNFSQVSNLDFISSPSSPSPEKAPTRSEPKIISTGLSDLEYQNDSIILQPSDVGVTPSQEDIIEFSDSGLNNTSHLMKEDLENDSMHRNLHVEPESSGKESEEVPETPEWLKRMSFNLGFTPPKMSRLLRK
ncbi:hypothetical protein DFH28DRAFT_1216406 [Melampsora americana]|nr:hypothetical protein DFH28DRAFT_1216406 [Melampsora americana]